MIVREQQKRSLADAVYARELADELQTRFREYLPPTSETSLEERISAAIRDARSRGLTWESSIGIFVILSIVVGEKFEEQPLIQAHLQTFAGSPNDKMDALAKALNDAEWDDVLTHRPE